MPARLIAGMKGPSYCDEPTLILRRSGSGGLVDPTGRGHMCKWIVDETCDPAVVPPMWQSLDAAVA
jgi:hypothetical protein